MQQATPQYKNALNFVASKAQKFTRGVAKASSLVFKFTQCRELAPDFPSNSLIFGKLLDYTSIEERM